MPRDMSLRDAVPGITRSASDRTQERRRGNIPVRLMNLTRHLRALQSSKGFTTSTSCSQILTERPYRIGHNLPERPHTGLIVASRITLETTFVAHQAAGILDVRHLTSLPASPRGCHDFEPYRVDRGFGHGEPGDVFFEALNFILIVHVAPPRAYEQHA